MMYPSFFWKMPIHKEMRTGTPKLSLCFKVKSTNKGASDSNVGDKGLEPLTFSV